MSTVLDRREAAYWLTLAFKLEKEPRRHLNGLVLTADRLLKLGLRELIGLESAALPEPLQRYGTVHQRLLEAEGRVSAQAFVVDQLLEEGIALVPITAWAYPGHLARRLSPNRAPTLLLVAGDPGLLGEPGVAVSGSREAGPEGLLFARAMGRLLAEAGVTLVSGLARGCDREAMQGALEAGGRVIGVAPEGILHAATRRRPEVSAGRLAVVSEFSPNDKWLVSRAMTRNLTIAGLSRGLIVGDCVAPGGTTDQVEVARGLDLPVFVRRGKGEGALVAELVSHPGVAALEWNGGEVVPPRELGIELPPVKVQCELRREQGRLVLQAEAPGRATLEELVSAVREAWQREGSFAHMPRPAPIVAEPEPTLEVRREVAASTAEESGAGTVLAQEQVAPQQVASSREGDEKLERIRGALAEAAGEGHTLKSLSKALGLSEKPLRSRLKLLEEQGLLISKKKARSYWYFLKEHAPPECSDKVADTQEQKAPPAEGLAEKSQLGLFV